jgi:hypothetical protein
VAARYILAALSVVFVVAAAVRLQRDGGRFTPASKTWFLVTMIFGSVSLWLWLR